MSVPITPGRHPWPRKCRPRERTSSSCRSSRLRLRPAWPWTGGPKSRRNWPQATSHRGDHALGARGSSRGRSDRTATAPLSTASAAIVVAVGPVARHAGEQRSRARLARDERTMSLTQGRHGVSRSRASAARGQLLGAQLVSGVSPATGRAQPMPQQRPSRPLRAESSSAHSASSSSPDPSGPSS